MVFRKTTLFFVIIIASVSLAPTIAALAQVMQSSNYQIESDSINIGGGFASSSSYTLEDTVGEQATGRSSSTVYQLRAGYQQMQEVYLAITPAADVSMTPAISGITGGQSSGTTSVTVTTDNRAGYQLTIAAEGSPAMQSGANSIADYVPAGSDPDFTFTTDTTDAHFAYSPEGVDIVTRFEDSGGVCGIAGGDTSAACWDGLSTTPEIIASRTTGNHPVGTNTSIVFRVGVGNAAVQPEGTYTATSTLTLLAL